jgi:hypothetical protein
MKLLELVVICYLVTCLTGCCRGKGSHPTSVKQEFNFTIVLRLLDAVGSSGTMSEGIKEPAADASLEYNRGIRHGTVGPLTIEDLKRIYGARLLVDKTTPGFAHVIYKDLILVFKMTRGKCEMLVVQEGIP